MSIHFDELPERYQKQLQDKGVEKPKRSKYGNHKVMIDGILFDSQKEGDRYQELKTLQQYGVIRDLNRQVSFELIPTQKDENNRVIERACTYKADFVYTDAKTGKRVVEDVKSKATKTAVYKIKKKLLLYVHGIRITEV